MNKRTLTVLQTRHFGTLRARAYIAAGIVTEDGTDETAYRTTPDAADLAAFRAKFPSATPRTERSFVDAFRLTVRRESPEFRAVAGFIDLD